MRSPNSLFSLLIEPQPTNCWLLQLRPIFAVVVVVVVVDVVVVLVVAVVKVEVVDVVFPRSKASSFGAPSTQS